MVAAVEPPEVEAARRLRKPAIPVVPAIPAIPAIPEPETLVTEDVSDKRVCYTIGPFKDKARAIEISGRYSGRQITIGAQIQPGKAVHGRDGLHRWPQDARER